MSTPDVKAPPVEFDSGWTILESPEAVPPPQPGSPYVFDGPWEFNPLTPVKLTVTDFYVPGDLFEVWNHGVFFGSGLGVDGLYSFADTPDQALGNPSFSQNSWVLQPGSYSLVFKATRFAPTFNNTSLAFRVDSKNVPEGGATFWLLGIALAGIAGFRYIRG